MAPRAGELQARSHNLEGVWQPRRYKPAIRSVLPFACVALLSWLIANVCTVSYKAPGAERVTIVGSLPNRTECADIVGKAFRSSEERKWFEGHCSNWPQTAFADLPIARQGSAAAQRNESPACAAVRGRPYNSEGERAWFLANCSGGAVPVIPAPATAVPVNPSAESSPDRSDCNAIRGTAYRSAREQAWFLTNCRSE